MNEIGKDFIPITWQELPAKLTILSEIIKCPQTSTISMQLVKIMKNSSLYSVAAANAFLLMGLRLDLQRIIVSTNLSKFYGTRELNIL